MKNEETIKIDPAKIDWPATKANFERLYSAARVSRTFGHEKVMFGLIMANQYRSPMTDRAQACIRTLVNLGVVIWRPEQEQRTGTEG